MFLRSSKPSRTASQISSRIKEIDFVASSFEGIGKSTNLGFELVSTIAKTGMFKRLASAKAICSFNISTMKIAAGWRVISEIEPKVFSSLSR